MRSIRAKYFLEKCLAGLNFMALGLVQQSIIEDWDNSLLILVTGIIIIGYFVFQFILSGRMKFEPEDEMTTWHECKAQAAVYNMLCILLAIIGLICLINVNIRRTISSISLLWIYVFYVLGIIQIVEYFIFLIIERKGDPLE